MIAGGAFDGTTTDLPEPSGAAPLISSGRFSVWISIGAVGSDLLPVAGAAAAATRGSPASERSGRAISPGAARPAVVVRANRISPVRAGDTRRRDAAQGGLTTTARIFWFPGESAAPCRWRSIVQLTGF